MCHDEDEGLFPLKIHPSLGTFLARVGSDDAYAKYTGNNRRRLLLKLDKQIYGTIYWPFLATNKV